MASHQTAIGRFITTTLAWFSGGARLADETDEGLAALLLRQTAKQRGMIPSARIPFSVNATNNDTLAIGGHTFKFVTALGAAAAQTQVKILGSAALTLAALLDAINGVTNTNVVKASTPFAKSITADSGVATTLRIKSTTQQGNGIAAEVVAPSIVLAASITAGGAWDRANLNTTGRALEKQNIAPINFTVTAEMATAGAVTLEFGFTVGDVIAGAGGAQDMFAWSGSTVTVTIDGVAYKTGDVVRALAVE